MIGVLTTLLRILIPLAILAGGVFLGMHFINTAEEPERRSQPPTLQVVEVLKLQPQDYQTKVSTRGTVAPRTQSTLVAEVAGKIEAVSPHFRDGSFFDNGEVLVTIDQRDYANALTVTKAQLAQAQQALSEEQAQSQQALRDWKKLGLQGNPNELVLRRPQLNSKQAAVAAAQAQVKQAETDLERTRIKAPYSGRILRKEADVGQFVNRGAALASVYAVDYVEVRLPITDTQATFLELPEAYQGENSNIQGPKVTIKVNSSGKTWDWEGRLVRTEGTIDIESRQQFVIVQVDKPYAKREDGRPPLKVGQFVTAEINGSVIPTAIVLPRDLIRGKDEVLVIKDDHTVEKRAVEVVWRDDQNIVIGSGLQAGERISTTLLNFATDGMKIAIKGEKPKDQESSASAGNGDKDKPDRAAKEVAAKDKTGTDPSTEGKPSRSD